LEHARVYNDRIARAYNKHFIYRDLKEGDLYLGKIENPLLTEKEKVSSNPTGSVSVYFKDLHDDFMLRTKVV